MAAVSTQRLLLGLALLLVTVSLVSAVCPARTTYFDTETTYGGTTYFLAAYNVWKSRYVVNGGATGVLRVQDLTDCRLPGRTVSEGIGYGLILSVFAGDRTTFDQLRAYYNRYQSDTGCMPYLIRSDGVIPPSGVGCAPDGDEDVAFALFVASYKWNDQVYYDEAIRVVHRLYVNNVNTTSFLFPPFPQTSATGIMNPSYIALGYYRTFAKHNKLGTDNWNQVVTANDNFLTKIKTNSNTKLVPDWADYNGKVITTGLTSGFFGAYAPGQDATNTGFVAPSTALGAWPFKIEFLTNGQASDTRFIITQVFSTLGDVKTVWVQCAASGWKQTTPVQQSNYMVRIFDNTGCTYPYSDNVFNLGAVTIRIFTTTNFVVDYKNVDSKTPGCEQDRNQFPGTYSYDAVRYPWRTAFDAVYFAAGTNSYNRCKDLIATFGTSLDGERALSGAVLTNSGKGFIFKSMAAVCHVFNTDATARATVWTALKNNRPANPANLLADNTYFGDSLHVLALLFTTGAMNTDMCRLADAAPKALSAGYSYLPVIGAAWRSSPPAINTQFCIRASNNKNLDTVPSWTVAVEFQDPNVKLYNVYLNCGSGKVLAQEPRVDPFNTRYITSACASSTLQIELSPKQGYLSGSTIYLSGSISTVANRCNVTAPTLAMGTQHCWNWATNANYWSLTSAWSLGSSVTLFCGKKGTTVALTAQNGGQWPYTYAASVPGGCPTEMGSTLAYNGSKVFLTNAAYYLCPFYCFRPVTDNKITVTFQNTVSAVSIHCGGSTTGYQTATSPFANTYQIPVTGCAADGAVSLRYTYYGTVYTVNPNYKIVPLCFPDQAAPFTTPPPPPPPPPSSNNRLNYVPFCLGVGTSIYYIDVRTYATQPAYVNGVTVTCGTNTYTLTQDASNPERFFSNAACPAGTTTYEVTLSYTSLMYSDWGTEIQRTFSATMGTHKCPALCYQTNSNTDQYFLGVGVSYVARNATVTCSSTGPLAMTISGGYFAGISMSPETNAPLYNGMIGSTSSCTNVKVWIDAADQPAGNALPPNGSGYYTLSGQWYTATSPAFEPIPVSDPRRCFK